MPSKPKIEVSSGFSTEELAVMEAKRMREILMDLGVSFEAVVKYYLELDKREFELRHSLCPAGELEEKAIELQKVRIRRELLQNVLCNNNDRPDKKQELPFSMPQIVPWEEVPSAPKEPRPPFVYDPKLDPFSKPKEQEDERLPN